MTSEQLQATRAERWRQQANPILILEDAEAWLQETGLCLFLPRKTQLAAPAPSFVEACLGQTTPTPAPDAIENANSLLHRLLASGDAVPLNLLGTVTEQPDFVATPEALSFIFALRGDRDWKSGPKGQSSPLVVEVWKLLDREGALTTAEIQDKLGRELTEAAVLRALTELWNTLRVVPSFESGQPTHWEPLQARFQKAMHAGGGMSLVTALSSLVTLYLRSAVAATGDEIETFLSPVASRSRIRDVVRGLTASRQLDVLTQGAQALVYLAGELPEFPETETPEAAAEATERRAAYTPRHEGGTRPPYKRPAFITRDKPKRRGPITPGGEDRPKPRWNRPAAGKPAAGGLKRPFRKTDQNAPRTSFERPAGAPEQRPRKEWKAKPDASGGWKPRAASAGERRPAGTPPAGRSYGNGREAGERRPFTPRKESSNLGPGRAPNRGPSEGRPYADRPKRAAGERPFTKAPKRAQGGERNSYGRTDSGGRKPFAPRREDTGGKRPYTPRGAAPGLPTDRAAARPFAGRPPRPEGNRPFKAKPVGGKFGPGKFGRAEGRPANRDHSAPRERTGPPDRKTGGFSRSGPQRTEGRFARPGGPGAGRPASDRSSSPGRTGAPGRPFGARPGGKPASRPGPRPGFKSARPGGKPGGFRKGPPGGRKRPE